MEIIVKNKAREFRNGKQCIAIKYTLKDKDINGSVIKLTGRYPDNGRVVNLKCKELAYVISGFGRVVIEDKEVDI